jgi:hypothetical protein
MHRCPRLPVGGRDAVCVGGLSPARMQQSEVPGSRAQGLRRQCGAEDATHGKYGLPHRRSPRVCRRRVCVVGGWNVLHAEVLLRMPPERGGGMKRVWVAEMNNPDGTWIVVCVRLSWEKTNAWVMGLSEKLQEQCRITAYTPENQIEVGTMRKEPQREVRA